MKKALLVLSIVTLVSLSAIASITLSQAGIQTFSFNNVTETDNVAAVTSARADFQNKVINVRFDVGTMTDGAFSRGAHSVGTDVQLDTTTGVWRTDVGVTGTLTADQLAVIQGDLRNMRNHLEAAAIAAGQAPGTLVPWP